MASQREKDRKHAHKMHNAHGEEKLRPKTYKHSVITDQDGNQVDRHGGTIDSNYGVRYKIHESEVGEHGVSTSDVRDARNKAFREEANDYYSEKNDGERAAAEERRKRQADRKAGISRRDNKVR